MKSVIALVFVILFPSQDWVTKKTKDYLVEYPSEWILDESGMMGTEFILFGPRSGNDDLTQNFNLSVQKITPGETLKFDEFKSQLIPYLESLITDFELVEIVDLSSENLEKYSMTYTGKQGKMNLRFEQRYFRTKRKYIVLTYTCNRENQISDDANRIFEKFVVR